MSTKLHHLLSALFFLCCLSCSNENIGQSQEWAQWRGPNGEGIWHENIQLETLKPENFKKRWEAPVSAGYSGPTLANGRVYLTDFVREGSSSERVLCFDALSGEPIWTYEYDCEYSGVGYPTGPRASVLVDEGKAYSFGTMGHLYCFDAASGEMLWHHNGVEEYHSRIPTWGLAASPIIENDLIMVQLGGEPNACMVAFDKNSGKEVWRALEDEASYSAPILIDQAGKRVLVVWTAYHIAGLNPKSGDAYWKLPFTPKRMIINVASPVYEPPYLFLSSFYDGSFLLQLDPDKLEAEILWKRIGRNERNTEALHSTISTPIIDGDYIYGVDSYGEVRCLELLTGDRVWENLSLTPQGRWANVHFIRQAEKVWAFNERGEMILGKFTPQRFHEYGRVKLIDPVRISPNPRGGVCWAHPAFGGRRVYLRSDEKMVCYEVVE